MATFAKQLDEERFEQSEIDRQKIERAKREVELAQQSVSDLQRNIDQENQKRQREVEIRMAALEVKAWEELSESENPVFSAAKRPDGGVKESNVISFPNVKNGASMEIKDLKAPKLRIPFVKTL